MRFGWAGTLLASFALLNAGLAPPPAPADGASSDAVRELATLLRGVLPALVTASNAGVCLLFARVEVARPPPLRTNRTRRVLHPILIGHAASFTPY